MEKEEFYSCAFVDNGLKFYTREEILQDINAIKRLYQRLTSNEKYLYRWYVYAHPNLDYKFKNLLWDILNNDKPVEYLYK